MGYQRHRTIYEKKINGDLLNLGFDDMATEPCLY
jgi:hypothetical protein